MLDAILNPVDDLGLDLRHINYAIVIRAKEIFKPVFHFNRIVAKRSVSLYHKFLLNVYETLKYVTFRYDTVEVENFVIISVIRFSVIFEVSIKIQ